MILEPPRLARRYFQTSPTDQPARTTVLVADDDAVLRAFIAEDLTRRGYYAIEAFDGGELLECVSDCVLQQAIHLDVILTDLRMPIATGADALRVLRRLQSTTKVIVMSAFIDDVTLGELLAGGADAVLAKPFAQKDLLRLLPPPMEAPMPTTIELDL